MRKLLILTLVLGMASLANATLTLVWSTDGGANYSDVGAAVDLGYGNTAWIGIHSDVQGTTGAPGQWVAFIDTVGVAGAADLDGGWTGSSAVYTPPGITAAVTIPYGYTAGGDFWGATNADGVPTNFAGIGTTFGYEFLCNGNIADGIVTIDLHDTNFGNVVDTLTINQIPEPITMALLGLGGLFLRRRK